MKRRVISHYELVRKIGAGGSGVVYLATDTLLQRPRGSEATETRIANN